MRIPNGGLPIHRVGGNYGANQTELIADPGYLAFDYVVPQGRELWLKSLGIVPNGAALSSGLFRLTLGEADTGTGGEPYPTVLQFDFDWSLVVSETRHVSVRIWSTSATTAVGAEITLYGVLFPSGTAEREGS